MAQYYYPTAYPHDTPYQVYITLYAYVLLTGTRTRTRRTRTRDATRHARVIHGRRGRRMRRPRHSQHTNIATRCPRRLGYTRPASISSSSCATKSRPIPCTSTPNASLPSTRSIRSSIGRNTRKAKSRNIASIESRSIPSIKSASNQSTRMSTRPRARMGSTRRSNRTLAKVLDCSMGRFQ